MTVFDVSPSTPLVLRAELQLLDEAELAAAAYLARYSGRTLLSYRTDLRGFFQLATLDYDRCKRRALTSSCTGRT